MCRLAAYLGREITLRDFFSASEHSLVVQAYAPKEMQEAVLNADGFGIGWFNDRGEAVAYKQTLPAWSDSNLPALETSLSRPLWVGNVRSATPGQLVHIGNTQPFIHDRLHFLHNGFIEQFQQGMKERLIPLIDAGILATLQGDTDSGWMAAMFHQQRTQHADIDAALLGTCRQLAGVAGDKKILANLLITDGRSLLASRFALNAECPSLYYLVNGRRFPQAALIASEPFDDDPGWTAVPAQQRLFIDAGLQVDTRPIA